MKNRIVTLLMLGVFVLSACGKEPDSARGSISDRKETEEDDKNGMPAGTENTTAASNTLHSGANQVLKGRPMLLGDTMDVYYDRGLVPSVPDYQVAADLSNVVFEDAFRYYFFDGEDNPNAVAKGLAKDGFVVDASYGMGEFFDIYEDNRYMRFPNFITVDSLMHTYHLYFASLMRNTEKAYLSPTLQDLSMEMLQASAAQYEALKGSDWEKAAYNNVLFFSVGARLQDPQAALPVTDDAIIEAAESELQKIYAADGIETSLLNGLYEDYSQYKPRGYYEGNEQLENYFRTMMWYGRMAFPAENRDQTRGAVLQCIALSESGLLDWERIYNISAFFAGASDDPGYYEMAQLIRDAYGEIPDVEKAAADEDAFLQVWEALKAYEMPSINSIPVEDGEDPSKISYRFMGQRFTIDAAIMQRLIYSSVGENAKGENRMLPDALDTAVVLGSKRAYEILSEKEDLSYEHFEDNLAELKERFDNDDPSIWNASLYSGWLYTLRPLLEEKGEGYPSYMQSENWTTKDVETFAASYAELKHDTVLYAKQVIAEMGGFDEPEYDDRGYVDPEIEVYNRFVNLAEKTAEGLKGYGMLSAQSEEDLERLRQMALMLVSISEKELQNQSLSEEEYELIRGWGGDLEHFWQEANQDMYDFSIYQSHQSPCPVVTDIATDPNGSVLEIASGKAQKVYVVFPVDEELHIASGSVYSFYQFEQPLSDRMTDSEWRALLDGGYLDDDWNWVESGEKPQQPAWTENYRIKP